MKRAKAIPNSDTESESTRLSVRRSRSKLLLLAPSAEQRAISGRRAAERAVIKPARLRQAINSTARTAAERASRLERAPLTTICCKGHTNSCILGVPGLPHRRYAGNLR